MTEQTRKNNFCVISKDTFGEHAIHSIQTNSGWAKNPYGKEYAVVPDHMVQNIMATKGYCDIVLNEDGTEVVSFTAREIPIIPKPEKPVSVIEQLRADIDYIALMSEVTL